jgi:Raf kinase inhibitor-like YbhB/YbcL family protein
MHTRLAVSMLFLICLLTFALNRAVAQTGGGAPQGGGRGPAGPPLRLTVAGVSEGGDIPTKNSCAAEGGKFVSPAVSWANTPAGTQSFVLLFHDVDAHPGKKLDDVTHWLIFNIPGTSTSLPENVTQDSPAGVGVQAANIRNQPAYFGPCPPQGGPAHHYIFELIALDTKLDLQANASRDDVMKAAEGHIVGSAGYETLFHR